MVIAQAAMLEYRIRLTPADPLFSFELLWAQRNTEGCFNVWFKALRELGG
jgi:hypothetical protein